MTEDAVSMGGDAVRMLIREHAHALPPFSRQPAPSPTAFH